MSHDSTTDPLPATPAAPAAAWRRDDACARTHALARAKELEAQRRRITLGGSALWIPIAGLVTLTTCAGLGMRGIALVIAAWVGVAIGPALTTVSIAAMTLLGLPMVRRRFQQEARHLSLPDAEVESIWQLASAELDGELRASLGRRKSVSGC